MMPRYSINALSLLTAFLAASPSEAKSAGDAPTSARRFERSAMFLTPSRSLNHGQTWSIVLKISQGNGARKNQATPSPKTSSRTAFAERVMGLLRQGYSEIRDPIKAIARDADATPKAAKNWWEGQNLPGLWHFRQIAVNRPDLHAAVAELFEMEATLDPELDRKMSEVIRLWQGAR